jgi:hypothetical protein
MKKILIFPSFAFLIVPFGGQILSVTPCCTGFMLTITLFGPKTYLFQPGLSKLITGNLMPGNQTLGLAIPGGACAEPPLCITEVPTFYTILFIGASQIPSL